VAIPRSTPEGAPGRLISSERFALAATDPQATGRSTPEGATAGEPAMEFAHHARFEKPLNLAGGAAHWLSVRAHLKDPEGDNWRWQDAGASGGVSYSMPLETGAWVSVEARNSANGLDDHLTKPGPDRLCTFLRHSGPGYVANALRQLGWLDCQSIIKVRFEDLVDGTPDAAARILDACGLDGQTLADSVLSTALNTKNRTSSGNLSVWQQYWSPAAEELFESIGAKALNSALGYE